jgi:hypothetical protein
VSVTVPVTGSGVDDPIARARDAAMPNATDVAKFRQYVLGAQPVTLSAEMQTDLAGILGNGYVDNLCRLAVQAAADFLTLARIDIDADETPERDALADFIAQTWTLNQVAELSSDVHFAAYRDGNYAVALSWDNRTGRVRFNQLDWWNGTRGAFVHYDDGGLADWAVHEWQEYDPEAQTTIGRRVVYYPDRFERFLRREAAGGWEMVNLPGDWPDDRAPSQPMPVPWVDGDGRPIGIPVVHFPSLLIPNHQPGTSAREQSRRYGLSLLAGGPLGVQDAINEAHYDLIAAARRTAFPIITATGVTIPANADGTRGTIVATPGMVLSNPSERASFGMLNPGDMSQLLNVLTDHHRTFARMTNTPMQIVAETDRDAASGVALLRMQLAAIRQARRGATVFGSRWGMLFHKAANIANAFGRAELNAELMLVGEYEPQEASDIGVLAEVAQTMRDAGFPLRFSLRTLGLTDAQADEVMGWVEEEKQGSVRAFDAALNGEGA